MNLRNTVISALAAVSLVAVPTVAMAAQAKTTTVSKLSVRSAPAVRQGTAIVRANRLQDGGEGGGKGGGSIVIALLAAAAIVAGIVIAADGSNKPSSPA